MFFVFSAILDCAVMELERENNNRQQQAVSSLRMRCSFGNDRIGMPLKLFQKAMEMNKKNPATIL
jgi:hypothetical protein